MNKKYNKVTNFVSLEELSETSKELDVNSGATALSCGIIGTIVVTIGVATIAACDTGACTSYCKS